MFIRILHRWVRLAKSLETKKSHARVPLNSSSDPTHNTHYAAVYRAAKTAIIHNSGNHGFMMSWCH
jgi:hypothetical protein